MRIGCLGLGNMGQPMAGKLLDGGHELFEEEFVEIYLTELVVQ